LLNKDNWLNIKNYSNRNKEIKLEKYWLDLEIKIVSYQLMRNNLTDLLKSKDLKRKRNNRKNGKRDKKLELIYFIKYLMTEREKLDSIKRLKNSNLDKNNLIKFKFKKESVNTSLNNKLVVKRNMRDPNYSKENCCNR
jgi:hypothetical protein